MSSTPGTVPPSDRPSPRNSQLLQSTINHQPSTINDAEALSCCLTRSVMKALADEPRLEAVTIDHNRQTVSVATLGKADEARLSDRVSEALHEAQQAPEERGCTLLEGRGECSTCHHPLTEEERQRVSVSHQRGTTTIARITCPTALTFWRWRDIPWPKVVPRQIELDEHELDQWKSQLIFAALCAVFGVTGWILSEYGPGAVAVAAYVVAYILGGFYSAKEVWERLRQRAIDVHFLMLAVAAGSASIGAWGEGAMLLFLFSMSGALEHYALGRTQREIRSLFREAPKMATVLDEAGHEHEVPVPKLRPGSRLLIKPGSQFPVDAEIRRGETASDESNLTGEATPVQKKVGDTVFSGTMNLWGAVEATVLRPASESALEKIIHLIRTAQRQKAPAQQFTDRFSTYYTYAVLGLSFVMFFVWWLGFGQAPFGADVPVHSAFYHTMTLLVVASPCALVLSIPSAILAAIAWGARHGVLFRGGAAVEKLAGITVVALDKTGTLTTGELRVESVQSFPPGREQAVAQLAVSLERLSSHPLGRAITRYGKQQNITALDLQDFESITGQGLKARHDREWCWLGRREWLSQTSARDAINAVPDLEIGFSEIWLSCGDLVGRLVLRDDIRPKSREVVESLKAEGLRTVVLTGDHKTAGEYLRTQLNVDEIQCELTPERKLTEIGRLTAEGQRVAMIGDGVNDAPSLAAAHIGVAMGARGSDAALEQADVILMHDRLENFLAAFRLSQRARSIIRQNLIISLGTVVVLVSFALAGQIPLTLGVVGHEGSTVIVVMNSLRLLFGRSAESA